MWLLVLHFHRMNWHIANAKICEICTIGNLLNFIMKRIGKKFVIFSLRGLVFCLCINLHFDIQLPVDEMSAFSAVKKRGDVCVQFVVAK